MDGSSTSRPIVPGNGQIAKIPSQGGPASQVTRSGGREAFESFDGKFVYYVKADVPGVWKCRLDGTEEVQVLPEGSSNHWALLKNGIYLLRRGAPANRVDFLSFETGKVSPVRTLPYNTGNLAFAVSPDAKWLLFVQSDLANSDIIMVETSDSRT